MATSLPSGAQHLNSTVMSGNETPSLRPTWLGRWAVEGAPAGHDGDANSENCTKWLLSHVLAGEADGTGERAGRGRAGLIPGPTHASRCCYLHRGLVWATGFSESSPGDFSRQPRARTTELGSCYSMDAWHRQSILLP